MRVRACQFAIVFAVLLSLFASPARANDWPQWRGPNRDARAADFKAPATWPAELTQKWTVPVGDGCATPALVGEQLYVFTRQGGDEVIRCLDAATGDQKWSDKYESAPADGFARDFPGPRSSPTVADGKLVTMGVRGIISCYDAGSGERLWRRDDFPGAWPKFYASSSPIIIDGQCIAQVGSERGGGIVSYDLKSGEPKWKWTVDGPAYGSPTLLSLDGMRLLVTITDKNMVALNMADQATLWQIPYTPPARGGLNYNASSPLVDGNIIYFSGGGRGTKAVRLEKPGSDPPATELWSNPDVSVQFNTPVLRDGFLYGLSKSNNLFCLSAADGKTAWTTSRRMDGRAGYGSVVDAGSVLLALAGAGNLIVFEPTEKEYKEIAKYKVADGDSYAYPVASGNRIFVKGKDSVNLWTVE
jgi:outer membrane protein assembly factor BamB